ncbi:hypothetical protein SIM20_24160 [Bacillus cereus group sp. BfR-BA-02570]|uniref:hypothetical protein n=1 Tax=Bacillus cereus group sp. BfR-BA-02570 TaxID=3094890 RepID=UPI0029C5CAFC|nr:hypothetical protein [Bacillus cereus group sp. BfR-BA-02570]MDX5746229.1 hypothetical protein [Bacillus cereus group sp. BfR-BA-02570]
MNLNDEKQEIFDLGIELYGIYEKEELKNTDPFFAAARMKLYKSVLALSVNHDDLNEEEMKRIKSMEDYEKILSTLPNDHLARRYYQGIQNVTPIIKSSVMADFRVTMQHFWSLIEKVLEKDGD